VLSVVEMATPLLIAVEDGDVEAVRMLMEEGADVDEEGPFGVRPLYAAVQEGHLEVVRTLLFAGADVEAQLVDDGWRPLHKAAENGISPVSIIVSHCVLLAR
jgi:ankyrin repeat protein